jgi:hypothetical protein
VEQATNVMDHLPPGGWRDLATKDDLEKLELRFEAILHREMRDLHRTLFFEFLAAQMVFAGLVAGVVIAVG